MSEHTITELLSPAFLSRMQNMLGDEYESFLKSYEAPRTYGLRVNTAKISCDEFERIVPFPVTPIPWISNGYFYPEDVRPSFCTHTFTCRICTAAMPVIFHHESIIL